MPLKKNEFDQLIIGLLIIFVVVGGGLWLVDTLAGLIK